MSKIILFSFVLFLAGAFIFNVSLASAAEISVSQTNISKEEIVILQQSLVALTEVLINVQAELAKSKDLPQNTAQIISNLSNISKSLAQISVTIEKRGLAVEAPKIITPQAPLVVVQKSNEITVKNFDEATVLEANIAESENQLETMLETSNVENQERGNLLASIGAIAGQRITWIVAVLLAIGAVLFWKMRGTQEVVKT